VKAMRAALTLCSRLAPPPITTHDQRLTTHDSG
jgi:hypothetical protein